MSFMEDNQRERFRFILKWAEYVRTHDDKEWSKQQNIIINPCLETASMTKEQFLEMRRKRKNSVP